MTHHRIFTAIAAAAATFGLALAGVTTRPSIAQPKNDAAQAELVQPGKTLYALHCSHCHGFNMVSAGTVTYDLREFPRDAEQRFFESVTNGKNNRMPPWGDVLTQDEIAEIWAYVRTGGKS